MKNVIYVLSAILLIMVAYWSCNQFFHNKPPVKPSVTDDTKQLQTALKNAELMYNNKIDSLDKINYALQSRNYTIVQTSLEN